MTYTPQTGSINRLVYAGHILRGTGGRNA